VAPADIKVKALLLELTFEKTCSLVGILLFTYGAGPIDGG
jgi:hypothetical protein